jgi:hypothetical protein
VNRNGPLERRETPRVDARLPLQLTETGTRLIVTTESVDLSRGGLACRTADYVAPLSRVALTLILPPFGTLSRGSRSLRAEGVVVRCEEVPPVEGEGGEREYQLACCFTALEPDAQSLLEAFVAWRVLRTARFDTEREARPHTAPAASRSGGPRGRGGEPRQRGRPIAGGRPPRRVAGGSDRPRSAERSEGRPHATERGPARASAGRGAPHGRREQPRSGGESPRPSSRPVREAGPQRGAARDRHPRGDHPVRGPRREREREPGRGREFAAEATPPERPSRADTPATGSTRETPEARWGRRPQRRDSGPPPGAGREPRK